MCLFVSEGGAQVVVVVAAVINGEREGLRCVVVACVCFSVGRFGTRGGGEAFFS